MNMRRIIALTWQDDVVTSDARTWAECLLAVGVAVELVGDDGVLLDVSGIAKEPALLLDHAERVLLSLRTPRFYLCASPGRRLARAGSLWARSLSKKRVVFATPEQAKQAALRLPLWALADACDVDIAIVDDLADAAIHHGSDLVALKSAGIAERLGSHAKRLQAVVNGVDDEPLTPLRIEERIHEFSDLEDEINTREPLLFVLNGLCVRLASRLQARQRQLSMLLCTLRGRTKSQLYTLHFPSPVSSSAALLRALDARLSRHQEAALPEPVRHITLEVGLTAHQGPQQIDAYDTDTRPPDALAALLGELQAELGPARVGVLAPTEHPWPERMSTWMWPPPVKPIEVTAEGRFQQGWPWPVTMLSHPQPVTPSMAGEDVLFAWLQGDLPSSSPSSLFAPYARRYVVRRLADGRRALLLVERHGDHTSWVVAGWFD
jgi:hypothetical protein